MDTWPDDGSPADFAQLVEPICKAIRFAYRLRRQHADQDIPYDGFEIGRNQQANCLLARHQLSAEQLAYSDKEQGRDALTEIVSLAVRLGIEQGQRIVKTGSEYHTLQLAAEAMMLLASRKSK